MYRALLGFIDYARKVVLTETLIMPEPQARSLSVLKSILQSQGQS
jgi:hypothetical protein